MAMKRALIVVDVQRDFCRGGVLPAKNTPGLIAPLNGAIAHCIRNGVACVFTRDWHPVNHCSFQPQGGPWPPHCVQGTTGADFAVGLQLPDSALLIDIEKDSDTRNMGYSAFENTNLKAELHARHIDNIAVCGIATDYCVKATALDGLRSGFRVSVLTDLVRPINVNPDDSSKALAEMKASGAVLFTSTEWMSVPRHRNISRGSRSRSKTDLGPIQVFLPKWDGKNKGDFYEDGAVQWKGFKQAEKEAKGIPDALNVEYNPMYMKTSGRDILKSMQKLYRNKHSLYFVITMSGKVEDVSGEFKAWRKKCAKAGETPPVLIATVASAPGLADYKNGIVRWYIRSDEESQDLANLLDNRGFERAATFCIDDQYGKKGLHTFRERFDGTVPSDLIFHVTAKTAKIHVETFLRKYPQKDWPAVFVIGYGYMVKNTLTELIAGGYDGCIVCTSTITDPQWRPADKVLASARAKIFTVLPEIRKAARHLDLENSNVVFFFTRKTLLRVLKLTAGNVDTRLFLKSWLNREEEGSEGIVQTIIYPQGDILVQVRVVNANKESREQEEALSANPILIIERLISRFHTIVRQLRQRHNRRSTLKVTDEYDVQDLFHALLKMNFDDVRPEESAPSYAGSSSRMDFLLKTEKIVVEVKKTRANLHAKQIGEQLAVDILRYKAHQDCRNLICFVYDPEERISNPRGLEKDLSEPTEGMKVKVYVTQK